MKIKLQTAFWIAGSNYRPENDYGDFTKLINSFVMDPWRESEPAEGCTGSKEQVTGEVSTREAKHQELKDNLTKVRDNDRKVSFIDPDGKNVVFSARLHAQSALDVFEEIYLGSKGKLVKPTTYVFTGNRRGSSLLEANTRRRLLGLPLITEIEVIVTKGEMSKTDVLEAQMLENNTSDKMVVSPIGNLIASRVLVEGGGYTQAALRKNLGDSKGVQMWYNILVALYEEREAFGLDFFKKLTEGNTTVDSDGKSVTTFALDIKKFSQTALQGTASDYMGPRCGSDTDYAKFLTKAKEGKDVSRPTKAVLAEWVERTNLGIKDKMMAKSVIEGWAYNKCKILKDLAPMILKNKVDDLQSISDKSEELNFAYNCSDEDRAALLEFIATRTQKVVVAEQEVVEATAS